MLQSLIGIMWKRISGGVLEQCWINWPRCTKPVAWKRAQFVGETPRGWIPQIYWCLYVAFSFLNNIFSYNDFLTKIFQKIYFMCMSALHSFMPLFQKRKTDPAIDSCEPRLLLGIEPRTSRKNSQWSSSLSHLSSTLSSLLNLIISSDIALLPSAWFFNKGHGNKWI